MTEHNRVYAGIDLDAIAYNMEQMKKRIGDHARLIAVVKADGYGHGAVPVARMFEECSYVWGYAVACLEEATELREHGIRKPILVLGCVFPDQFEEMIRYDVRPAVYMESMAELISQEAVRQGKDAFIHIKIDTGMGRIGFPVTEESADAVERISRLPGIRIEGMFTHFAKADERDKTYTFLQHDRFIGIAMYGMYPSDEVDQKAVDLRPALSLVSHVSFVKEVEAGTPISYGGTFVSDRPMRVATIPVGYGDGYPRSLSNKGYVLIHGKRARILGRVCMDQFMADVTDIPETAFMDRVVLVGRDGDEEITVDELADLSGRFNYEFVCCLGKRIPR